METPVIAGDRKGGLQSAIDIIVAPNAAFARLRERPTWGWAFLIAALISIGSTLVILPAIEHAVSVGGAAAIAANPQIAKMPADQQQKAIEQGIAVQKIFVRFSWVFGPIFLLVTGLLQAVVMLVGKTIGGGDRDFKYLWALAMNVQVAGAIGGIALAIIVLVRGADSFTDASELQKVLPNLGMLVPGPRLLTAFFGAFNIAALWQAVLLALGMQSMARISKPVAWIIAIVFLLFLGAIAAFGAASQPQS